MKPSHLITAYDHIATPDYANDPYADNKRRAAYKRMASAAAHIEDLFSRHARLMVVKVVLWYEKPFVDIPRDDAMFDFDSLWYRIDGHSKLQDYLGFIWKLEYGSERGTHFHLVLFYNGAKYLKNGYFGQEVKRLWEEAVGTNAVSMTPDGYCQVPRIGSAFVCNPKNYSAPALGVVHRDDALARQGLMNVAAYLGKHDDLIGHISRPGERNFGVMYRKRMD